MFLFFFSSRRRHTRYWRDWSSDVCSSDLGLPNDGGAPGRRGPRARGVPQGVAGGGKLSGGEGQRAHLDTLHPQQPRDRYAAVDRESVVEGKRVDIGGRRIIKKKKQEKHIA